MKDVVLTLQPDMEKYLTVIHAEFRADMAEEDADFSYRVEILEMLLRSKKLLFKEVATVIKDASGDDFDAERFATSWEKVTGYNAISENLKQINEDHRSRMEKKLAQYENRMPLVDSSFTTPLRSRIRETCKLIALEILLNGGVSSVQDLEKKARETCEEKYGTFESDMFLSAFITALGVAARYNTGQKQNRVPELLGIILF